MKIIYLTVSILIFTHLAVTGQPCTPLGNQTSYGINNVWIGYVYDNANFTTYRGYVNEGTTGNPAFNQSFGGSNVSYPTNGCTVNTETFSVRYKLRKAFTSGNYEFTAGGDDGYRLSIDGGATWIIDRWFDQGYNTTSTINFLNGTYDIVLEFYENSGGNQVSFDVQPACVGTGNPAVYGTGNVWQGYVYDGTNFSVYRGAVTEGTSGNPNFDESFGGANTTYNTSSCSVQTETFSVRYRLQKTFTNGSYIFILGGDDGYRFSIDGGSTWVIDRWYDQSYNTASYTATLNGTYNLVIEFYESGGDNRISFDMNGSLLPVRLLNFTGNIQGGRADIQWAIAAGSNPDHFEIERSSTGQDFQTIGRVEKDVNASNLFRYTDRSPIPGNSYYRLKILDLDGNKTYSQIIKLTSHIAEGIAIFPTIVQNNTLFISSGKSLQGVSFSIFDMSGKKLNSQAIRSIAGGQVVSISLPGSYTRGTYFIEVNTAKEKQTKKILITQ